MELFESMTVGAQCWQRVYVCAVCVYGMYTCMYMHTHWFFGFFFLIWGGELHIKFVRSPGYLHK